MSRGLTLLGLATAALSFALMQTVPIPALPGLRRDLGTTDGRRRRRAEAAAPEPAL